MTTLRHRPMTLLAALLLAAAGACTAAPAASEAPLSDVERAAIADTIQKRLVSAYDLSQSDVVAHMMSIYPRSGSEVISAAGGRVTASRDTLEEGIYSFWETTGKFMKNPRWEWGPMHVDVLSSSAAVLTTTYVVPHLTPENEPHIIGGAWTSLWKRIDGKWLIVREHLSDMPRAAAERVEATMHRD
ncbi:MAG: DUF4440 domain-containing protein [Gemmatimonadaceae bacterium]